MIIWLASYPKSGNTWVRSFISALYYNHEGKNDFSNLKKIKQFPTRSIFEKFTTNTQDVKEVLPQLVKKKDDGYLGVRHDRLVGLLIESVKEQQKQIEELKSEIQELKNGSSK